MVFFSLYDCPLYVCICLWYNTHMECIKCGHTWKVRKKKHRGNWHCPECGDWIRTPCPKCGKPKGFSSKFCPGCACKYIPRKRPPSRLGIPTKNGYYIDKHSHGRTQYKMVLCPSHHRAKSRKNYVYEHILVWEKTHDRLLPKDWIIHHLNGNGLDNRPCNLMAMPRKQHSSWTILRAAENRILSLETEIKELRQLKLNLSQE